MAEAGDAIDVEGSAMLSILPLRESGMGDVSPTNEVLSGGPVPWRYLVRRYRGCFPWRTGVRRYWGCIPWRYLVRRYRGWVLWRYLVHHYGAKVTGSIPFSFQFAIPPLRLDHRKHVTPIGTDPVGVIALLTARNTGPLRSAAP